VGWREVSQELHQEIMLVIGASYAAMIMRGVKIVETLPNYSAQNLKNREV
jgi:hypothetical protein